MPEIKNTFLKSRMNKDTEARILPQGEYRDAQNASVSASEDASVGSLENIRGNKLLTNFGLTDYNIEIIGQYADVVNNRIFFFLTNYTDASADSLGNLSKQSGTAPGSGDYTNFVRTGANNYIAYCQLPNVADSSAIEQSNISFDILLSGTFLNFSKTHPISGINIVENLLFWTDNRNQPRKINVDNAIANPLIYYTNEDHISVAKYAPYEPISFLKNTTGALESTLINEYDEWLPPFWGAPGQILNTVTPNALIFNENTASDPANESYSTISDYLGTSTLSFEVKVTSAKDPNGGFAYVQNIDTGTSPAKVKLKSNQGPATPIPINDIAADLAWTTNTVFLFSIKNPNYNASFSGDKKLLEDKFVRFSYRFKYDDNEYSLAAPFTQHAFVPKQYGYFLEGDDERTKESSIVSFMENQITTAGLVINLPYKSNELADKLKVNEIQLLYKASDDLNVKVIADVKVSDLSGGPSLMSLKTAGDNYTTGTLLNKTTTGGSGSGLTVDLVVDGAGRSTSATVNKTGEGYKVGDVVSIPNPLGTDAEYTVTSLNSTYIYNYSSEKPIKVLTDEEVTRVSDIVPMRAQTQEIVGNRVVYGNFLQNNATPLSLDYRLETTTKGDLSNSNTDKEFLNNTLKQNRSYQVGIVLQDRYGRASNVIINQLDLLTKNSTIFNSYTNGGTNPLAWPGEALKVVFNSQIPSELSSSLPYNGLWKENENPLGWYTYKIVVQQQEQDYYNIYVPGALSGNIIYNKNGTATPATFEGLQYSNTSSVASIALFNDNINKIPRDLKEVGPTDNIYGSSVILYNRVKQNIFNPTVGSNPVSTQANVTIGEQNISPLKQEVNTVRPFSELGAWTNKKNIDLHYANMDQDPGTGNPSSQYGLGSFIYPGLVGDVDPFFLRNNKNPLIATISTQKRMGFTSTNQEKGEWNFADKLMVFETEPFKSNIDIYYETSTTGIISELNNSILTSEGSGTTDAPAGLSSVNINNWFESSTVGQSISNIFEVVNSQGGSQAGNTALTTNVKIVEITNSLSTSNSSFSPISQSNWPIEIVQVSPPVAPNVGPKFQLACRKRIIFENSSDRANNYNVTFEISTDTFPSVQVTIPAVKLSNITPTIYRMSIAWPIVNNIKAYGAAGDIPFNAWIKSQDPNTFLNSNVNNKISSIVSGNTGISYDQEANAIWIKNNDINDYKNNFSSNASIFRFQSLTNGYDVVSTFHLSTDSENIDPNTDRLKGLKYKIFNVKRYEGARERYDNPDTQIGRMKPIKYYKFNNEEEDVTDQFSITLSEFDFAPLPSGVTPVSYVVTMNRNALPIRGVGMDWAPSRQSCYVYVIQVQCTDASDGTGSLASSVYTLNFIITK